MPVIFNKYKSIKNDVSAVIILSRQVFNPAKRTRTLRFSATEFAKYPFNLFCLVYINKKQHNGFFLSKIYTRHPKVT